MFPDFTIFGNTHPMYGTIGLVALVIGAAVASLRIKRFGFKDTDVILATAVAGGFLLLGAGALYALVQIPILVRHWAHFAGDITAIFRLLFSGMVFYGGLIGAVFGLWVFTKIWKKDFGNLLRLAVPVLPLTHGIMRIGCFLAGCCHGMPHDILGIAFTRSTVSPNGIPFLPVPLYESALNFVLFAILWQYSKKERQPVQLISLYAIPYAIGRFGLEFLRGDAARGFLLGLSTSQFISVLLVIGCVVALILTTDKHRKTRKKDF